MSVKSNKMDIDPENPPMTEAQVRKGWVRLSDGTRIVPARMDAPTYQWFMSQGQDIPAQIEAALRDYAAARRREQPPQSA